MVPPRAPANALMKPIRSSVEAWKGQPPPNPQNTSAEGLRVKDSPAKQTRPCPSFPPRSHVAPTGNAEALVSSVEDGEHSGAARPRAEPLRGHRRGRDPGPGGLSPRRRGCDLVAHGGGARGKGSRRGIDVGAHRPG